MNSIAGRGSLSLVSGTGRAAWPSWYVPYTAERVRSEKDAARSRLDAGLAEVRAALRPFLFGDGLGAPLENARALSDSAARHSMLGRVLLEAAFGKRQANYLSDMEYRETAVALGLPSEATDATLRVPLLPSGWEPTRDDDAAAELINRVDGSVCAQVERVAPLHSRWRARSGAHGSVFGRSSPGTVHVRFDDGKRMDFGLHDFIGDPAPWFTRLPSLEECRRSVPIGSLWQLRGRGRWLRVQRYEDGHEHYNPGEVMIVVRHAKGTGHEYSAAASRFLGDGAPPYRRAGEGRVVGIASTNRHRNSK